MQLTFSFWAALAKQQLPALPGRVKKLQLQGTSEASKAKRIEKHEAEAKKESSPFAGCSASDARDGCSVPLERLPV